MKLTVNGKEVNWEKQGVETIHQLMDQVYGDHVPAGQVVTQLLIDGKEVTLEEEEEIQGNALTTVDQIDIVCRNAKDVLRDGLRTGDPVVDQLMEDCQRTVDAFRKDDVQAGGQALEEATGLIQWMLHLMHGMKTVLEWPADNQYENRPFSEHLAKFEENLRLIHEHAENRAFPALCDSLEQSFLPNLPAWKAIFRSGAES